MKRNFVCAIIIIISVVLFLFQSNISCAEQSALVVYLDWNYYGKIPLFEDLEGKNVIDTLQNDSIGEDVIHIIVDTCINNKIYGKPGWEFQNKSFSKGWINLSDHITVQIYPFIYEEEYAPFFPLYFDHFYDSGFEYIMNSGEPFKIIDTYQGWVKIKFMNKKQNRDIMGWISPRNQCTNIYGGCH